MLHGENTFGYHLVNVLLHSACTLLLYFVGLEVFRGDRGMSVLSSLLFATHPIHTDAIDSIVGRAEGLYALFYLMSFLAYVRCASPDRTSWGWYGGYVVCFVLSVLSKEMGLMVLANCWAWDLLYNHDCWSLVVSFLPIKPATVEGVKRESPMELFNRFKPFILRTLATTLVGAAFMLHRKWWVGSFADLKMQIQHNPIAFAQGQEKWLTIFYIHFQYLWLQLWPAQLSCDYSMACIPMITSLYDPRNLLTLLTYVGLAVFLVLSLRSQHWHAVMLVSLSWYIIPFIPASQVLFQPGTVIAERVLYIPSIGICFITAWVLFTAWRRGYVTKEVFLAVCLIILLAYSARTLARNPDWHSQRTLFKSAIETCPNSGKARYNYAAELEMAREEEEAEQHYMVAASISDSYTSALGRLGKIWLKRGNLTRALEFYAGIINRSPKLYHEFAWHDTAYLLWQLGDLDKAITFFEFAMSITPKGEQMEGDAETNLGCLYLSIGAQLQLYTHFSVSMKLTWSSLNEQVT
jgi:tetratricopeptide (TPR) repeat protein